MLVPAWAGTPPFQIVQWDRTEGGLNLEWQGGAGPYQVQMAPGVEGPWSPAGDPVEGTSATVAMAEGQGFVRVVAEQTARYRVTFNAQWSATTHPASYPGGAHWSGLVGGVHNSGVTFWEVGGLASLGIKNMAEFGSKSALLSEVTSAIQAGTAKETLSGAGVVGVGTAILDFEVSRDYPLVTLVSMIAPSPDWFTGVGGLSLLDENGAWRDDWVVSLGLYDAGTDSGPSYASPNQVTSPFVPITMFTDFPALVGDQIVPFGNFTFERLP